MTRFAVIIPSTNTVVETDFWSMRAPNTSFHSGRMLIESAQLASNADFERLLEQVDAAFDTAVASVLTAKPDHLIMGMSAPTFWGGKVGHDAFIRRAHAISGLPVTTGSQATRTALEFIGARRIAVLTPYQPIMREQIVRYYEDFGFDVTRYIDMRIASATAIADVTESAMNAALDELAADDVDAIVQAGTNLPMVRLAHEATSRLGKPVVAINAATLWSAYRACQIAYQFEFPGPLPQPH